MAKFWYSGDINCEHGGTWYRINPRDWDSYGYCSAIRVTPCSDGGAQENAYWIEELTVLKPETESDLKAVLDSCGWINYTDGSIIDYRGNTVAKKGTAAYRRVIAESCVGYGRYDIIQSETVQIGKKAEFNGFRHEHAESPHTVLRANTSLERYIRRNWLRSL